MGEVKTVEDLIVAIDDGYDQQVREERARCYIGASIVGNPCDAMLSFNLRGFPNNEPSAKLKRIFKLGHLLEDEVVSDLKEKADVRVWEKDGFTGRQHSYDQLGGHVVCHMDGHIEMDDGVLRVLEIKSMNNASFNKFVKHGVRKSHPQYFGQVTMMMGMANFTEAMLVAVNKNNSEYHAEIIEFDEIEFNFLRERVDRALQNKTAKIASDEDDWRCRGCFKRGVCWGDTPVPKTCVTCQFAFPTETGLWHCSKHDEEAVAACNEYLRYKPEEKA